MVGSKNFLNTFFFKYLSLGFVLSYFIFVVLQNEVPIDDSDGLQHYFTSQYAWSNHTFFLNHWGKPLFILFSSPFAQFGFKAYLFFNLIVFLLSVLIVFSLFRKFKASPLAYFFFPISCFLIPDYVEGVCGGMTEPFFGLLLLLILWLGVHQKWILFALVTSFLPFARSEGMLVILMAGVFLLVIKEVKALPFLLIGFILYAFTGKLLLNDWMWYFNNDPYPENSPYGNGTWYHYLQAFKRHIGIINFLLLPFISYYLYRLFKKGEKRLFLLFLFFIGIYILVIVVHSYLWANGLKGAMGLSRLATLGVLPVLFFAVLSFNLVISQKNIVTLIVVVLLSALTVNQIAHYDLPTKETEFHSSLKKAIQYTKKHYSKKTYYFHPMIAYYEGINTFDTKIKTTQSFGLLSDEGIHYLRKGDCIIRDSQFGPVEQGMPFDRIEQISWLKKVKTISLKTPFTEYHGEPRCVIIYEVMPQN
jgi:hypothetical protein